MTDCMLDIESWGTRPGCAIRSIGACTFDPNGDGVGETFYANILDISCEMAGLTIDPDTVAWWSQQSKAARDALLVDQRELREVLWDFSAWFQRVGGERIWSHGANFDEPILEAAYRAEGSMLPPWSFWNSRCTRTVYDLAQVDTRKLAIRDANGIEHNALDDAKAQASAVQAAIRRLYRREAAVQTGGVFA